MSWQWVRPDSHTTSESGVSGYGNIDNPEYAYDADPGTYAYLNANYYTTKTEIVYFSTPRICNQIKVKFRAAGVGSSYAHARIYVRVDGAWVKLLDTSDILPTDTRIYSFTEGTVDAIEFQAQYTAYYFDNRALYIYDVQAYMNVNTAPSAPTGLLCNGQTNPTAVDTPTPPLSAIYNDPDSGDIAKYYQLQIASDSGFSNIVYDSGKTPLPSDVTEGNRCPNLFPSSLPLDGQKYWWRIRFWDDDDAEGEWSTE